MVVNIESFVDYNITTIQEIFLAIAWEEKQETVEEQTLISRTLKILFIYLFERKRERQRNSMRGVYLFI